MQLLHVFAAPYICLPLSDHPLLSCSRCIELQYYERLEQMFADCDNLDMDTHPHQSCFEMNAY